MSFWMKDDKGVAMKKEQGTPRALPIFSVDTIEEARSLRTLCCSRTYPPNSRYVINYESGFVAIDIKTMGQAADWLAERYKLIKKHSD